MINRCLPIFAAATALVGVLSTNAHGEPLGQTLSDCANAVSKFDGAPFPIREKEICSININGTEVKFYVSVGSLTRRPLLSSELSDFFKVFGDYKYTLIPTDSEYVFFIKYSNDVKEEYLKWRFESYIIAIPDKETSWIRCSVVGNDGCVLYNDILPRYLIKYSENSYCSTIIRASFQRGSSAEAMVNIVIYANDLANIIRSRHFELIQSVCERGK